MLESAKKVINTQLENHKKPTPKYWLLASRILKVVGKVTAGAALLGTVGPWIGLSALLSGEIIGEVLKFKTEITKN